MKQLKEFKPGDRIWSQRLVAAFIVTNHESKCEFETRILTVNLNTGAVNWFLDTEMFQEKL